MPSFLDDHDDLRWYLDKGLDWTELVMLTEHDLKADGAPESVEEAVEGYREILDAIGTYAAEMIAPRARDIDTEAMAIVDGEVPLPPALREIFDGLAELDVYGLCVPRELGGLNLPFLCYLMSIELIGRADVSTVAHYGFHGGIAMALLLYSIQEGSTTFDPATRTITATRFAEAIEEIRSGAAWGSMDITEADAGSDMGALRTRAELGEDGVWRVTGTKIYITSGHGRHHVVIARTEEAKDPEDPFSGLGGLSLFHVPAWTEGPDGARVRTGHLTALEHKLGHNGSATIAIAFDNAPAELIGKRGEGFKQMLLLMNNARVGVGFECLGLMEAAHRQAREYAAQRPSMGKMIDRHEIIADYLDEMDVTIRGIRALAMEAAVHEEIAQKIDLRLKFLPPETAEALDAMRSDLRRRKSASRRLTPLLKWIAAEEAVRLARLNVQIHGGAGYCKDYTAEKLLRDAVVMPIYEGTSQIQALMATKDTLLSAIRAPGAFLRKAATARWRSVSATDALERRVARLQTLSSAAQQHLLARVAGGKMGGLRAKPVGSWSQALSDWDPKRDFAPALLHAERLIAILADEAIAEVLWSQAERDPTRREVLERWLERAEARCRMHHDRITTTGDRLLATLSEPAAQPAKAAK